jgi:hypothetical protein
MQVTPSIVARRAATGGHGHQQGRDDTEKCYESSHCQKYYDANLTLFSKKQIQKRHRNKKNSTFASCQRLTASKNADKNKIIKTKNNELW